MLALEVSSIPLPCTEADIKATVEAELASAAISNQFDKACFIRDWVYRHKTGAAPGCNLLDDHHKLSASEFYNLMRTSGGFVCSGTAYFLKRLYELMGFVSYAVNIGLPNWPATHVTNLVEIEELGREIFSVQDAYFNFTFSNRDGQPLCFTEVQSALRRKDLDEIVVLEGPSIRSLIAHNDLAHDGAITTSILSSREYATLANGTRVFDCNWTLGWYMKLNPKYRNALMAVIGEEDMRYLFLFPFGTSGETKVEQLLAQSGTTAE